ncbi:MAG: hypothetical protein IJ786_02440 [Bacteroidaceae bacterium]|nr:hypothetical protein [Bacteroidaceae bacterium]
MNTQTNDKKKTSSHRKLIRRLGLQVALFILLVAVAIALYALTRGL